ncbi:hypothetical protein CDAR_482711 [Caerostris darwini]|uniref:Uncharacterized protein n=1 Tax=Caerostris darwini TaxID=1538125 RepID=A0AAV4RHJ2_9ARAC|nr:hypothetical protein CDAR_482711 [Caerostris darwini]
MLDIRHSHMLDMGHPHMLDMGHSHMLDMRHSHMLDMRHSRMLDKKPSDMCVSILEELQCPNELMKYESEISKTFHLICSIAVDRRHSHTAGYERFTYALIQRHMLDIRY